MYPTDQSVEELYEEGKILAKSLKERAQQASTRLASQNVRAELIFEWVNRALIDASRLEQILADPGIPQYAKDRRNDQSYDVVAQGTQLVNAVRAAGTEVGTNYNSIVERNVSADGSSTIKTFTPAQTAAFRTFIDAIVSAVE